MPRYQVAVVRYKEPMKSLRRAVDLSGGLAHLKPGDKVFIKPNIVFWTKTALFPKWGVITTSRVVADMVAILAERGVSNMTIGEGMVLQKPNDKETPAHAFESLGYRLLKKRFGVKYFSLFDRSFEQVDLGDGTVLNFNSDFINSDFLVNIPVLKTHSQTRVSLGIKNLKGTLDIASRKKCHAPDPIKDLNYMVAKLAESAPPSYTLIDGIYTLERGPGFDGKAHRNDLLVGASDMLSTDMVGAKLLGFDPADVPYLRYVAHARKRSLDLSDVDVVGVRIEDVARPHQYQFEYNADETLPLPMERLGIRGLSYKKYDLSICTYCSWINGTVLSAVARAWRGVPWDDVEVLTGKIMQPTPGKKKTILLGRCMYQAHKDSSDIEEMIAVKSCPPQPKAIVKAFHQAGIDLDPHMVEGMDDIFGMLLKRYEGKPEFDESFYRIE